MAADDVGTALMADELQLQFDVRLPPGHLLEEWRREPPQALRDGGFELADDSYNSLTWESRYEDWPQKVLNVTTLGMAKLFGNFGESIFRVTARFDEQGSGTRVTMIGTAHPRTRAALGELAAEHGGPVGLRVGV